MQLISEWGWLALGGILLILEIVAPGVFLLFIGAAALVTGGIFMLSPAVWQIQMAVFALLSLISIYGAIKLGFYTAKAEDSHNLNKRADDLIGQTFPLYSAIIDGRGYIKIGDSLWQVSGNDLHKGALVRIIAVISDKLEVEAV